MAGKKQIIFISAVLFMAFFMLPGSFPGLLGLPSIVHAEQGIALDGQGTKDDPWKVSSAAGLELIRKEVAEGNTLKGKYVQLTQDIQLPDGWSGIGALKAGSTDPGNGVNIAPFSGTFDGADHTVTAADGGKPLFGYVREANICNLGIAGYHINGNGLIGNYVVDHGEDNKSTPATARVWNVIIRSGTSIRNSGIVSGYAAAGNSVDIMGCLVEEDVVIGYDKTMEKIGSFGGDFNGSIINCRSRARVYGTSYVGGIMGCKGNSMSVVRIVNCEFTGQVVASGTYAGGIAGGGYGGTRWGIHTAPNAYMLTITNCSCSGSVTGADIVGGIEGYETTVQVWESGIGHIRSNLFTGTVTAAEGSCAGGIIGGMRGIDRYNMIEDNYYSEDCGSSRGIGGIEYVDTSCTTHETQYGQNYFDSSKEIPVYAGVNDVYSANIRANHNRQDDPLGADAANLARGVTAEELRDGTVTAWLNTAAGSCNNWFQEDSRPGFLSLILPVRIEISEDYRKEYDVGEALDLHTLVFELTRSDGNRETVYGDDENMTIKGYDSSRRATLSLTALYDSLSVSFTIRIVEPGSGDDSTEADDPNPPQDDLPEPSDDTSPTSPQTPAVRIVKGKTYLVSKNSYKVIRPATGKKTGIVTFTRAKNAKKIVIPAFVKLKDGRKYKVTAVGKKAFTAKKIRKVTIGVNVTKLEKYAFKGSGADTLIIKTAAFKKAGVKGSLRSSRIRKILIRVGSAGKNKSCKKKYKKVFSKKNAGKKVIMK